MMAATARAFATYSLVPYLGILFCPGAVVVGTVGVSGLIVRRQVSGRTRLLRKHCRRTCDRLLLSCCSGGFFTRCRRGRTLSEFIAKENDMRIIFSLLLLGALLTGAFAQRPRTMEQEQTKAPVPSRTENRQGQI